MIAHLLYVMIFIILKCILLLYSKQYSLDNNQCNNQVLIIQKMHAVLMLTIRHLIYVCCLKLIFFMNLKMICKLNHNIMQLATSLLRIPNLYPIYPNYVLYGMYEIGDCLYVIVLALFYHSSYPSLQVNYVS